jgi:aryl-alcohol dehydrogenase-like predicted oxidoreductase
MSGTYGNSRNPGPSTYWIDAVITLDDDQIDDLTASYSPESTAQTPSVVDGMKEHLPTQWSMWQAPDPQLLVTARELGVGIVAWSPLDGGFLTGTVHEVAGDDFRTNIPCFATGNLAANNERYAPVRGIAADLGLTAGQLALAWLLHQDDHVVPIPGSRTPAHIAENLDAARVTLHPDTLAHIDRALARFTPNGEGALF